jgi:hypothetical protein
VSPLALKSMATESFVVPKIVTKLQSIYLHCIVQTAISSITIDIRTLTYFDRYCVCHEANRKGERWMEAG